MDNHELHNYFVHNVIDYDMDLNNPGVCCTVDCISMMHALIKGLAMLFAMDANGNQNAVNDEDACGLVVFAFLHRVSNQNFPNTDEFSTFLFAICQAIDNLINSWNGVRAYHSLIQGWANKGDDTEDVLVNPIRNPTMDNFKHKEVYYLAMYICEVDPTTNSKEQAFCKAVVVFIHDIAWGHANPDPRLICMGVNRLLNYNQIIMEIWDGCCEAFIQWNNDLQVDVAAEAAAALGDDDSNDISLDRLGEDNYAD